METELTLGERVHELAKALKALLEEAEALAGEILGAELTELQRKK